MAPNPQVGTRISVLGHNATIRYLGSVTGYSGLWLGVEWDEPSRGKHDGSKDQIRYFTCRAPGTPASFIRPSVAAISYGTSFLAALTDKYIDDTELTGRNVESVILGSSSGAIIVEAPRLSDVRRRLAKLESLRVASLDSEQVSNPGLPGEIKSRNLRIETLDLSRSLLANWKDVFAITSQLPLLRSLIFNDNRFAPIQDVEFQAIPHGMDSHPIPELGVNNCLLSSHEIWTLSSALRVSRLEAAKNSLSSLDIPADSPVFHQLRSLGLASNLIANWSDFARTIQNFDMLQDLNVSENLVEVVTAPEESDRRPEQGPLRSLALTSNRITAWASINALSQWFPNLERLNVLENPFLADPSTADCSRQLLIARFPALISCNGSSVSAHERKDSELFYLTFMMKAVASQEERLHLPQWDALCKKHGTPDEEKPKPLTNNLNSKVTEIHVRQLVTIPPLQASLESLSFGSPPILMKVLPSMNLKTLKAKALKSLKIRPAANKQIRLWVIHRMDDEDQADGVVALREMDVDADGAKELDFWSFESGTGVGVLIE